jgi:hypothetical protein
MGTCYDAICYMIHMTYHYNSIYNKWHLSLCLLHTSAFFLPLLLQIVSYEVTLTPEGARVCVRSWG